MKMEEIQYWVLGKPQQWIQETKAKETYTLNLLTIP